MVGSCAKLVVAAVAAGAAMFPGSLGAQAPGSGGRLCVYASQSYSEGAFVCAQRGLMLSCALEGGRAVWKPAAAPDLGRLCVSPLRRAFAPRKAARRVVAAPIQRPAPAGSAKCFVFNGKQYCE